MIHDGMEVLAGQWKAARGAGFDSLCLQCRQGFSAREKCPRCYPDTEAQRIWATARGFDLKAPHWDDLDESIRECLRRIVRNLG